MKKVFLFLIFIGICLISNGQILRIEIDQNYLVVTDTVNNIIKQFPRGSIDYEINGSNLYLYAFDRLKYNTPIENCVDSTNTVFNTTTINAFLRANTGFNPAGASAIPTDSVYSNYTGWGLYADEQYTEGSPFVLLEGEKKTLPNNAATKNESQLPIDVPTFYVNSVDSLILGRSGDGILIKIEFLVKPTSVSNIIRIKLTIDVGGSVGEIFPRELNLTKGQNVEHPFSTTISGYTLDTWQSNGGKIKVEAFNGDVDIYNISYVITRTHKAR